MLVPRLCYGPVVSFGFPVPDRQPFDSKIRTTVIVTRYNLQNAIYLFRESVNVKRGRIRFFKSSDR